MSENKNKKSGRPKKAIDWDFVEEGLIAGSSGNRIALALGIHRDTLYDAVRDKYGVSFSEYSLKSQSKGEVLLEMAQFDEAVNKRDRGMLIWLGKQRLGQRDNKDSKVEVEGQTTFHVVNFGSNPDPQPYQPNTESD